VSELVASWSFSAYIIVMQLKVKNRWPTEFNIYLEKSLGLTTSHVLVREVLVFGPPPILFVSLIGFHWVPWIVGRGREQGTERTKI
jgi:hypothetical protein